MKVKSMVVYQGITMNGNTRMSLNSSEFDIEFRNTYFYIISAYSGKTKCIPVANVSEFEFLESPITESVIEKKTFTRNTSKKTESVTEAGIGC